MYRKQNSISLIPTVTTVGMFVFIFLFSACENDLSNVRKVTATADIPDQITTGLHTVYSDSGIVQYEIYANRVEMEEHPVNKTIFKNGFQVIYYKDGTEKVSTLSAEYGEIKESENKVIAKNNVIFTNHKKHQTLKTEELFWDQGLRKVRTTKNFFVESPTTTAKGVGLEADETFSNYTMHNFSLTYKDTTNNEFSENE